MKASKLRKVDLKISIDNIKVEDAKTKVQVKVISYIRTVALCK